MNLLEFEYHGKSRAVRFSQTTFNELYFLKSFFFLSELPLSGMYVVILCAMCETIYCCLAVKETLLGDLLPFRARNHFA